MLKILRGVGIPPFVTRAARGLVELALLGALGGVTIWINETDELIWAAPALLAAISVVEGWVDQIDPAKQRTP